MNLMSHFVSTEGPLPTKWLCRGCEVEQDIITFDGHPQPCVFCGYSIPICFGCSTSGLMSDVDHVHCEPTPVTCGQKKSVKMIEAKTFRSGLLAPLGLFDTYKLCWECNSLDGGTECGQCGGELCTVRVLPWFHEKKISIEDPDDAEGLQKKVVIPLNILNTPNPLEDTTQQAIPPFHEPTPASLDEFNLNLAKALSLSEAENVVYVEHHRTDSGSTNFRCVGCNQLNVSHRVPLCVTNGHRRIFCDYCQCERPGLWICPDRLCARINSLTPVHLMKPADPYVCGDCKKNPYSNPYEVDVYYEEKQEVDPIHGAIIKDVNEAAPDLQDSSTCSTSLSTSSSCNSHVYFVLTDDVSVLMANMPGCKPIPPRVKKTKKFDVYHSLYQLFGLRPVKDVKHGNLTSFLFSHKWGPQRRMPCILDTYGIKASFHVQEEHVLVSVSTEDLHKMVNGYCAPVGDRSRIGFESLSLSECELAFV
jgi:hypothetical protein